MTEDSKKLLKATSRAKELIKTAKHACMATVNEDGTPLATPFYLMLDKSLSHVYFGSHLDSLHSQNVIRTGQLFVVVYDMVERGGLYIKAINGHKLSGKEFDTGLAVHNATRARDGKEALKPELYSEESKRYMFGAELVNFWVNLSDRGEDGYIIRDYRQEISREELLD